MADKKKLVLSLKESSKGQSFQAKMNVDNKVLTFFIMAEGGRPVLYKAKDGTTLLYCQVYAFHESDNKNSTFRKK